MVRTPGLSASKMTFMSVIIILLLQKGILSMQYCETMKDIPGAEGESIDLQVNKSAIKEVSWVFGGRHIATTIPDRPIEIKTQTLKNRLEGKPSGSLTINKLTKGDQGTYAANIFVMAEKEFVQCYNLTIYKKLSTVDIEIHQNNSGSEPCEVTITCKVDIPNVKISWTYLNITKEENSIRVKYFHTNVSHTCTATNLVSRADRMVLPENFCGEVSEEKNTWSLWIPPLVILVLLAATSAILIWFWKKKTGFGCRTRPENLEPVKLARRFQPSEPYYNEIKSPRTPPFGRENPAGMVSMYDEIRIHMM